MDNKVEDLIEQSSRCFTSSLSTNTLMLIYQDLRSAYQQEAYEMMEMGTLEGALHQFAFSVLCEMQKNTFKNISVVEADNKLFCCGTCCWTKQMIYDQLGENHKLSRYNCTVINDDEAQRWVEDHDEIRDSFPSEDSYCRQVYQINKQLIDAVVKRMSCEVD